MNPPLKELWPIDGHSHHDVSRDAIYTNVQVNSFLDSDRVTVLIASKGMGKTLLLRTKKKLLEDSHVGALAIPRNQEYDEPVLPAGMPSHYSGYEDADFWCDIWSAGIVLSIMSHSEFAEDGISKTVNDLTESNTFVHAFRELLRNALQRRDDMNPSFYVGELLNIGITAMERMRRSMHLIRSLSTLFIKSAANVFIDAFDQALTKYFSGNLTVWRQAQLGLLLATHRLNTGNSHIKVYASIRQEAFADFTHEHAEVIKGRAVRLVYDSTDLRRMFIKAVRQYSEHQTIQEFLGVDSIPNEFYGVEEKPFEYIYRHSSASPRSVMFFGRELAHAYLQSMTHESRIAAIKEAVNRVSTEHIFDEYLRGQREIFLRTLSSDRAIAELFKRIPRNILNLQTIEAIRRELAAVLGVDEEDCYPFCDLFNIGLLGTAVPNATNPLKRVQRFRKPSEFRWVYDDMLSTQSVYFLHPGLHSRVHEKNRDYEIDPRIIIGDGRTWNANLESELFPTVFVSHTKSDKVRVEQILEYCAHHLSVRIPHDVWYDSERIRTGESLVRQVEKGISDSELVLLCASREALQSGWVEKEWTSKIASEISVREVHVMVVLLDDISRKELPGFLQDKVFLRIPGDTEGSDYLGTLDKLVSDIATELARRSESARPQLTSVVDSE